jgi:YegS/Rv2252/BmrU family lipid kinase
VRPCVIFNPAAKGQKAQRFQRSLDTLATTNDLLRTTSPGDARRLAAEAIREGRDTIIAAGGDGTLNEVLNGFGDVPDGFARARIGVLPLGTINVFARELGMPMQPEQALPILARAHEARIDLPFVEHGKPSARRRTYFAQLAGAGLDARAIELLDWPTKKRIGPLAYIVAGLKALREKPAALLVTSGDQTIPGQLVLVGNGRLYGGTFRIFPAADLRNGLLDVCVFPRANWWTLARCGPGLLLHGHLPASAVIRLQVPSFTVTSRTPAPFEVDGELGHPLPATFSVCPAGLRVIVP